MNYGTRTLFCIVLAVFVLSGCVNEAKDDMEHVQIEKTTDFKNAPKESEVLKKNNEQAEKEPKTSSTEDVTEKHKSIDPLSAYSSRQIEYARVWQQLAPNPHIEELNIRFIKKGEPLNPYEETSAVFPEDVVLLEGERGVDGSVTYSGNGDGTVIVYNVPRKWGGAEVSDDYWERYTSEILENAQSVYIEPWNDQRTLDYIRMQVVHP
ncbi:hypothetical protein IMZ31_22515 (plasmid) [Pontibacillus sp. ALD_SL1]|uniref:hypothetical protein n=1 Tax=Pontibacillus sp. ALD_SL1 TaxID=2777185 RepID=UPI001A97708B|nr:hypothetical protein [Pontibacillus sp. ALD_SL1]QST02230.1 hypothetical protein IMZ31_22515 [Pontibacillus sp. ALD_SL1]